MSCNGKPAQDTSHQIKFRTTVFFEQLSFY